MSLFAQGVENASPSPISKAKPTDISAGGYSVPRILNASPKANFGTTPHWQQEFLHWLR